MEREIHKVYELELPSIGKLYAILEHSRGVDVRPNDNGAVLQFYPNYNHPTWALDVLCVSDKELIGLREILHNYYYIRNFRNKYRC